MLVIARRVAFIAALSLPIACERERSAEAPVAEAPPPSSIRINESVVAAAGIRTERAVRARLAPALAVIGEIAADPDRMAMISSPVPGRLDGVLFKEGQRVGKGDTLARVAVTEIAKLRAARAVAASRARAARADANRLKDLVAKQLRPEQALLDAEAAAASAESEAKGLAAQLDVLGAGASSSSLPLLAPINGVIVQRDAVVGAPVAADDVLARVVDLSSAWFVARVLERDLARVKKGALASVVLDAYPTNPIPGVVEAIADRIDPIHRTIEIRVRVADPAERLKIGLYGSAFVTTDEAPQAEVLTIPRTAVIEINGRKVAFVRVGDAYEQRVLALGAGDRDRLEVIAGVRDGEEVVSEGAFSLKSVVLRSTLSEE